ncbi:MAG: L-histidine N(alpha)-methyltransferase [Acidimicrobiales bacterium]
MTVTVTTHLGPDDIRQALRADVAEGLVERPKHLPPKWFYDDVGSELFDKITRLAEYYPTEAERAALSQWAPDIAERCGADTVMELGSGSSDKTRVLLDAIAATGRLARYVPFDVSAGAIAAAAPVLIERYPALHVDAVVGDFDRHMALLPAEGQRLLVFLGGTIGNYAPAPRARLLASMASTLRSGESLLLGTDLTKDPDRLVAAYDDESGVTAEFNRNVLAVVNRELGANFDLELFEHVAKWNSDEEWIEMWLRSTEEQTVTVSALDLTVHFDRGEEMLTEISAKFRRAGVEAELDAAGFALEAWYTDPAGDFALSLSRRR